MDAVPCHHAIHIHLGPLDVLVLASIRIFTSCCEVLVHVQPRLLGARPSAAIGRVFVNFWAPSMFIEIDLSTPAKSPRPLFPPWQDLPLPICGMPIAGRRWSRRLGAVGSHRRVVSVPSLLGRGCLPARLACDGGGRGAGKLEAGNGGTGTRQSWTQLPGERGARAAHCTDHSAGRAPLRLHRLHPGCSCGRHDWLITRGGASRACLNRERFCQQSNFPTSC